MAENFRLAGNSIGSINGNDNIIILNVDPNFLKEIWKDSSRRRRRSSSNERRKKSCKKRKREKSSSSSREVIVPVILQNAQRVVNEVRTALGGDDDGDINQSMDTDEEIQQMEEQLAIKKEQRKRKRKQAERERMEREQAERERMEREQAERERLEREQQNVVDHGDDDEEELDEQAKLFNELRLLMSKAIDLQFRAYHLEQKEREISERQEWLERIFERQQNDLIRLRREMEAELSEILELAIKNRQLEELKKTATTKT